ncbi:MAG: hypothetical protein ILA19_04060 [Bacilli bacterium]|nr:hypothetical protein [Bacilli bacterium]
MEENKDVETITNEEQPTVQSVEPNNNDKKGNNKKLITIILIIAAGLCVVFAVVFFVFFNHSNKDDEDYDNEPDVVEKEDEDKKETTDDETKKEDKTDENKQNEECEYKGKDKSDEVKKVLGKAYLLDTRYSDTLYLNSNYNYSQISDTAKFYIAIRDVEPSYDKRIEKHACIDYSDGQYCQNFEVISFASVKQAYNDIFGVESNINSTNFNNNKITEKEPGSLPCPAVVKIENDDIYLSHNCGGTYGEGVYADYVYDYKKNDSTVEVYVAVAYWKYQDNKASKTTIYKDYEFKNAYKTDVTFKDCIKIDKDNYDEFSKFKIVYEKNSSGKYIFKSSERISSGK